MEERNQCFGAGKAGTLTFLETVLTLQGWPASAAAWGLVAPSPCVKLGKSQRRICSRSEKCFFEIAVIDSKDRQ